MVTSCNRDPAPISYSKMAEPPHVFADRDGNVVHVDIPCATMTPYQDYRDFMEPGQSGERLIGPLVAGQPTKVPAPFEVLIQPAEATLVFDNSEGCQ